MTRLDALRQAAKILGVVFAPLIVVTIGIRLIHGYESAAWAYGTLALSTGAGLLCLWSLPISKRSRIWLSIVYVPVAAALLVYYSLIFACAVFGDCL